MSPGRSSQVKTLLERVLARPVHEREEFLRHACAGDQELYDEVSASRRGAVPNRRSINIPKLPRSSLAKTGVLAVP